MPTVTNGRASTCMYGIRNPALAEAVPAKEQQ